MRNSGQRMMMQIICDLTKAMWLALSLHQAEMSWCDLNPSFQSKGNFTSPIIWFPFAFSVMKEAFGKNGGKSGRGKDTSHNSFSWFCIHTRNYQLLGRKGREKRSQRLTSMDPGTVRGTMVTIFLQILPYDLRLCFRLVTKLSVWTDKMELADDCGKWPFPLRTRCPSGIQATQTHVRSGSAVQVFPVNCIRPEKGLISWKDTRQTWQQMACLKEEERQHPGYFLVAEGQIQTLPYHGAAEPDQNQQTFPLAQWEWKFCWNWQRQILQQIRCISRIWANSPGQRGHQHLPCLAGFSASLDCFADVGSTACLTGWCPSSIVSSLEWKATKTMPDREHLSSLLAETYCMLPTLCPYYFSYFSHAEVLEQGPSPALCSSGLRQDPSEAVTVRKTKRIWTVMMEKYQKWPLHCCGAEEHLRKSQGDETIIWWWQRAREMDIHHGYKTYHADTPEYKDLGTASPP